MLTGVSSFILHSSSSNRSVHLECPSSVGLHFFQNIKHLIRSHAGGFHLCKNISQDCFISDFLNKSRLLLINCGIITSCCDNKSKRNSCKMSFFSFANGLNILFRNSASPSSGQIILLILVKVILFSHKSILKKSPSMIYYNTFLTKLQYFSIKHTI